MSPNEGAKCPPAHSRRPAPRQVTRDNQPRRWPGLLEGMPDCGLFIPVRDAHFQFGKDCRGCKNASALTQLWRMWWCRLCHMEDSTIGGLIQIRGCAGDCMGSDGSAIEKKTPPRQRRGFRGCLPHRAAVAHDGGAVRRPGAQGCCTRPREEPRSNRRAVCRRRLFQTREQRVGVAATQRGYTGIVPGRRRIPSKKFFAMEDQAGRGDYAAGPFKSSRTSRAIWRSSSVGIAQS